MTSPTKSPSMYVFLIDFLRHAFHLFFGQACGYQVCMLLCGNVFHATKIDVIGLVNPLKS